MQKSKVQNTPEINVMYTHMRGWFIHGSWLITHIAFIISKWKEQCLGPLRLRKQSLFLIFCQPFTRTFSSPQQTTETRISLPQGKLGKFLSPFSPSHPSLQLLADLPSLIEDYDPHNRKAFCPIRRKEYRRTWTGLKLGFPIWSISIRFFFPQGWGFLTRTTDLHPLLFFVIISGQGFTK